MLAKIVIVLFCNLFTFAYANEKVILQLKSDNSFQYAGYYAAKEMGYYDEVGLDVDILPAQVGSNPIESVIEGHAQYAVGNSAVLIERDKGHPLVILAVVFQHSPAVFITRNDVLTMHDWHLKRIMLEPNSEELLSFLKLSGVAIDSLNLVEHSYDIQDLIDSRIDVMSGSSTIDPFFLDQAGFPYRLFTPRALGIDFFGDNLFTTEQEINYHPKRAAAFREASLKGWQFALENQELVIGWILNRYKSTYSRPFLHYEVASMAPLLQSDLVELGYLNKSRWRQVVRTYQSAGLLSEGFNLDAVFYTPPHETDWRYLYWAIGILTPLLLLAGIFSGLVVNTNRKLDLALKESQDARVEVTRQANRDTLTGLGNRRYFKMNLDEAVQQAKFNQSSFALFYVDLDYFKEINDVHGHLMGDRVLMEVAKRLKSVMLEKAYLARIGGDEFTVLLSQSMSIDQLQVFAETILKQIKQPFNIGIELVHLSASIGISLFPDHTDDSEDLLKFADEAMYAAKKAGRNQICFFTPTLHQKVLERQQMVADLRLALQRDDFFLEYQPIIDFQTNKIVKLEALVRWQHAVKGRIPPDQFIPLAEEIGVIGILGDRIFKTAVKQVALWREEFNANLSVCINTSPAQYVDAHLHIQSWFDVMDAAQLPGEAVTLEITENMLMSYTKEVTEQLLAFRDKGIHVALDDFGTGYSSLAYLNRFDIDFIKIDKTFVFNLERGSQDVVLCEAIITMAHKLNLKVVAEGVETLEQAEILQELNCDLGQGYYFDRPLAPDVVCERLKAQMPKKKKKGKSS